MTEPLAIHSGAIPEPFQTSRARADQGAGNREHGTRDGLSLTKANVDTRASAREDSLVSVGRIIDAGLWASGERHDVVRSGEREPIPPHVRSAVWYRDRGRCELCAAGTAVAGPWHLDHITPWSAGGTDRTTNLRVLCEKHNVERSNYIDPTERPRRAATWWCYRCYGLESEAWRYDEDGFPICPVHVYSIRACPVKRGYLRQLKINHEMPTWHRRQYVEHPSVIAYCAHCSIPSLTDAPL